MTADSDPDMSSALASSSEEEGTRSPAALGPTTSANAFSPLNRPTNLRERWAEELLDRLTPVMAPLGLVFALVVLGQQLTHPHSGLALGLAVLGWALWAAFAGEFLARLVVAPDTVDFFRRNWWQLFFLVLPFLRVLRLVRSLRLLRTGQLLSSTVRGSRSAQQLLRSRLGCLTSLVALVVLATSQLLYQFSDFTSYGKALHDTALGAVTGEPLGASDGFAQVVEVALAVFSVIVFGTLAGSIGAFFTAASRPSEALSARGTQAAASHCEWLSASP